MPVLVAFLAAFVAPPVARAEAAPSPTPALLDEAGELFAELQDLLVATEVARQEPLHNRLTVLVSLRPDRRFELEAMQLKIDGALAVFHEYADSEIEALVAGGAHRLLSTSLPAGEHELVARWVGRVRRLEGEEPVREVRWRFRSGEAPRVVELELSQGEGVSVPRLRLREWH